MLRCDHTYYPMIDNIRYFLKKKFFRRETAENSLCGSLPLVKFVDDELIAICVFYRRYQFEFHQSVKIAALSSWALHDFLKRLEAITCQIFRMLLTVNGSIQSSK